MSPFIKDVILPAVFPATVAAMIVFGLGWSVWKRGAKPLWGGCWAGALAIGLAVILGQIGTAGWYARVPEDVLWPRDTLKRFGHVALLALIAGLVEALLLRRDRSSGGGKSVIAKLPWWMLVRAAVCAGAVWIVLINSYTLGTTELRLIVAGIGAYALVLWVSTDQVARRRHGWILPLQLTVILTCASLVVLLGASYDIVARIIGSMTSAVGVGMLVGMRKPSFTLERGGAGVWAVCFATLFGAGCIFGGEEPPLLSVLFVAAAPLTLWLGAMGRKKEGDQSCWKREIISLVFTLILCGIGTGIAVATYLDRAAEQTW